ncbi:MAG: ATP-binding protein [Nitrospirae bacterium]|nr:ATP-binding protein [Nitrospirota bacterium]
MKHDIKTTVDIGSILGQEQAKRAIEVAAVIGANILFIGGTGNGKTMLTYAYAGLLGTSTEIIKLSITDNLKGIAGKIDDCDKANSLIIADDLPEFIEIYPDIF